MELTLPFMIITNTLSFLGSLTIIILYCHQKYILKQKQQYAQTMIMRMSLSDLVYSLSMFIYIRSNIYQIKNSDKSISLNTYRCQSQAIVMHYSAQSCFINCFNLTFCTYLSLVKNVKNIENYDWYFLTDAYIFPGVLNIFGYFYGCYGEVSPYLCFLKPTIKCPLILFYVPYVLIVLANFYFLWMSYSFINSITPRANKTEELQPIGITDVELKLSRMIVANMVFYPLILCVCWICPLVWRICSWTGYSEYVKFLQYPNFILADLQGFFNCIFFLYNIRRSKFKLQFLLEEKDKINSSIYEERGILQKTPTQSATSSISDTYSDFTR